MVSYNFVQRNEVFETLLILAKMAGWLKFKTCLEPGDLGKVVKLCATRKYRSQ